MSFTHELVQNRMPASQQAMLHSECHQLLTSKSSSAPPVLSPTAPMSFPSGASAMPPSSSVHPAPETPSRTPPKATGMPSPTTAGPASATTSAGYASSGTVRPIPVAAQPAPTRFVSPVPAPGGSGMYWTQAPGTIVNGAAPGAIVQPLYMPTLSPGPFFLSPPPQAPQRYMLPTVGGNLVPTAGYGGAQPVAAYNSATGPFPDLPEELVSRVASYLRQARSKGVVSACLLPMFSIQFTFVLWIGDNWLMLVIVISWNQCLPCDQSFSPRLMLTSCGSFVSLHLSHHVKQLLCLS